MLFRKRSPEWPFVAKGTEVKKEVHWQYCYPGRLGKWTESTDERLIREGRVVAPLVEHTNMKRAPFAIINRKLYKIDYSKAPVLNYD